MKTAHSNRSSESTQKFTEIQDIIEDIVILRGGSACLAIEVTSSNFALLSREEQEAKLYAYAALLNSLSFSVQILVQNKKFDLSSYLKNLEEDIKKTQNKLLATHIQLYKDFVQELIKVNSVLDKNFYMIVPYSYLEQGAKGAIKPSEFFPTAKAALHTKATALQAQIDRLGLRSKILDKEELIRLFYSIYNDDLIHTQDASDINTTMVHATNNP